MYPQELNKISGVVLTPADDIPAFGDEKELNDYLPSGVRLGNSKKNPLAIIAARRFDRVYAQKGVFTIQHKEVIRIEELKDSDSNQPHLLKIKIQRASIGKLRKELALLGVNKLTIFPQLDNAASQVMEAKKIMTFECNTLNDSTVMLMYLERKHILLSPPYQREGEVWTLYKKQLLIDSLINGYDIPKLYLHQYDKVKKADGELIKYAIVDGKQRLLAIWQFMDGGFPLSDDIEYLRDPKIKLKGLKYEQLREEHLAIHARFTGRTLSVITIRTGDIDLIEDMFSRLNEAVPLNAAEKRNAFGGPLPIAIRELVKEQFFTAKVTVSSSRYRHHALACCNGSQCFPSRFSR